MVNFLSYWMISLGYVAIVMPLIFRTQSVLGAMLLYIPLSASLVYNIVNMLLAVAPEYLQRIHPERITLDSSLEILRTHLIMGHLHFGALAGVFIYLAIGYTLTFLVFRRQELEF